MGHLELFDTTISNTFIKREIMIKALNSIDLNYLNQNMIFYEDTLINTMLVKVANSLYYLKTIGYYYIHTPHSSTKEFMNNDIFLERFFYSLFIFLRFIFYHTKNNKYEKSVANEFINKEMNLIFSLIGKIKKNQIFYINIINLYINNQFIASLTKSKLEKLSKILLASL